MNEPPQSESSTVRTTDLATAVSVALRNARAPLQWGALLAITSAVLLLAVAVVLTGGAILDSKPTAAEAATQLPVVGLFVLASALSGYLGARAWIAASSIRAAERLGAPHQLSMALQSQVAVWWALALAAGVALLFPALLLVASIGWLARRLG